MTKYVVWSQSFGIKAKCQSGKNAATKPAGDPIAIGTWRENCFPPSWKCRFWERHLPCDSWMLLAAMQAPCMLGSMEKVFVSTSMSVTFLFASCCHHIVMPLGLSQKKTNPIFRPLLTPNRILPHGCSSCGITQNQPITETSPKHHQDTTGTSLRRRLDKTATSPSMIETSARHEPDTIETYWNITEASVRHQQSNAKTRPRNHRDNAKTSPRQGPRHPCWHFSWCMRDARPPYPCKIASLWLLGRKCYIGSRDWKFVNAPSWLLAHWKCWSTATFKHILIRFIHRKCRKWTRTSEMNAKPNVGQHWQSI